jgi:hypothetical protein
VVHGSSSHSTTPTPAAVSTRATHRVQEKASMKIQEEALVWEVEMSTE